MSFKAPSLINLCIGAIKDAILDENGNMSYIFELPSDLFDQIVTNLPPLALQSLQDTMNIPFLLVVFYVVDVFLRVFFCCCYFCRPSVSYNDSSFSDNSLNPSRKRKRFDNFDMAWKALYESRWPDDQTLAVTTNWQQMYWEKHLQYCLDTTAETVSVTLFDGHLGDVILPDSLLNYISTEGHVNKFRSYSKLSYHCERFGPYARYLRLQSVHCVSDISYLLRKSRLEYLEMHWIKSKEQVEGLCKLLEQNKETLASLEFVHCKLVAKLVTTICDSLHVKGFETNMIKKFSIKRSSFLDSLHFPLPLGLESLLSKASGLTSLVLSDNQLVNKTAKFVFDTLLKAESSLQVLDLSENNIVGWLSHFRRAPDRQINNSLKFLRVLNLRGNNLLKDDAYCLTNAMVYMPNIEVLNLSDNFLQDDGVIILVRYLIEKSKCGTPLAELYLENCGLTCKGGRELLKGLVALKVPLKSLSIEYNILTSKFGASLGRFLSSGIQSLNVKGIGLSLSGFSDAREEINEEMNLISLNISDNGGLEGTANFLSKVISNAPKLVSIDASNNWIPIESLPTICSFLEAAKGKLEHLDLRYNPLCGNPDIASLLAEFQINGKPNILLSKPVATLYDNDP